MTDILGFLRRMPRDRSADLITAAAYGTVLILAALPFVRPEDVANGHGIELLAAVGLATWIAHVFADMLGEHVRHADTPPSDQWRWSLVSGLPILVADALPAAAIGLGQLQAISEKAAIWMAIAIALVQLVGLGAVVGSLKDTGRRTVYGYIIATLLFGVGVTVLKVRLAH